MRKFKLSVHQYRQYLLEEDGEVDEVKVKKYAIERHNYKCGRKPNKDIEYQEEVLERMVKRGCKSCEKKQQEKYIESLKND